MTENEKLDLLLSRMQDMNSEMQGIKSEMQDMNSEMQEIKRRTTNIELTLENEVNRNIQILAENHLNLVEKLNQAIAAADKNLIYQVKVNYLEGEVRKLKEEVTELKSKIA
ncbi:MAG: hypothetical protein NC432_02210 [Roseburia sp.]|nr:hypothetical protein [Roseburia sp.]MCM1097495.1 hypothetical protein [Ruminococcus flavefaciens]